MGKIPSFDFEVVYLIFSQNKGKWITYFLIFSSLEMSDDEFDFNDSDYSGNISLESDDEVNDDFEDPGYGEEPGPSREGASHEDDYPFEVLSTEHIVDHMVDCIRDVNTVIQIPTTTVRILLNHFKWDKEKLMERYFQDDQDKMFEEAKVVPPNKKIVNNGSKIKGCTNAECGICFLSFPKQVRKMLENIRETLLKRFFYRWWPAWNVVIASVPLVGLSIYLPRSWMKVPVRV